MSEITWTPLNIESLRKETKGQSGELTKAAIYDVPVAFFVVQDEGLAKLRFKYVINDEPTEEVSVENATMTVGKHSRRLYGLSVLGQDESINLWDSLLEGLNKVLAETKTRKQYYDSRENFGIARRVVKDHGRVAA